MDCVTLGRTGLRVSVAGLGCGGNSRIGLGAGLSTAESVALVREAMELGITLFDTARSYGTEDILGRALSNVDRDGVVISTKASYHRQGELLQPSDVVASLDASLRELRTDYVDVLMLHAVHPTHYDAVRERIVPALLLAQRRGKFRHLAVSERAAVDHDQRMLRRALPDGIWDVAMVAFHMLHQQARHTVFRYAREHGIGTLLMFAVRNVFSRPGALAGTVRHLVGEGRLPAELLNRPDPLDFLIHPGGATTLQDAAYRYARHESGADVVLFGTGSVEHLRANVASITAPPLPPEDVARLAELFGHLRGVGLDHADNASPGRT